MSNSLWHNMQLSESIIFFTLTYINRKLTHNMLISICTFQDVAMYKPPPSSLFKSKTDLSYKNLIYIYKVNLCKNENTFSCFSLYFKFLSKKIVEDKIDFWFLKISSSACSVLYFLTGGYFTWKHRQKIQLKLLIVSMKQILKDTLQGRSERLTVALCCPMLLN